MEEKSKSNWGSSRLVRTVKISVVISAVISAVAGFARWMTLSGSRDSSEQFLRELAYIACAAFWWSFIWVGVNLVDSTAVGPDKPNESSKKLLKRLCRPGTRLPVLFCLCLIAGCGVLGFADWWRSREQRIFREEVLRPLQVPHRDETGFWVGDITENYRLGKISRQLAEADTAPLNPLVPKPVPIHGYYVRVMDTGPSFQTGQSPMSFKGMKRCPDNYAILIYPTEPGPGKYTFIYAAGFTLRRNDAWAPTFSFPTDQELKKDWGKPF